MNNKIDIRKQVIKAMNTKDYYLYKDFCLDVGICRFNFSKWMNRKQTISTNTFFKILNRLEILCPEHNLALGKKTNLDDLLYLYENQDKLKEVFKALDNLKDRY